MQSSERPIVLHVFSPTIEPGRSIRQVVESVGANGDQVKFVAHFIGSFLVYTRVETPSLEDAQAFVAGPLWDAGVRSQTSTEIKVSSIRGPKRASPPYCALVRVRAAELRGVVDGDRRGPPDCGGDRGYGLVVRLPARQRDPRRGGWRIDVPRGRGRPSPSEASASSYRSSSRTSPAIRRSPHPWIPRRSIASSAPRCTRSNASRRPSAARCLRSWGTGSWPSSASRSSTRTTPNAQSAPRWPYGITSAN